MWAGSYTYFFLDYKKITKILLFLDYKNISVDKELALFLFSGRNLG